MKFALRQAMAMLLATTPLAWAAQAYAESCPPSGWNKSSLVDLAKRDFSISDDALRNELAGSLQPCLRSPDPGLRDGVAFSAYVKWLRSAQLTTGTRGNLLHNQLAVLDGAEDAAGFARPFAALVLAELARADALRPELTPAQRNRLLGSAVTYITEITDYRGFDAREGWRHGVAHGADLLMQISRHPLLDRADLRKVLDGLAAKIAPDGEHFYVFGEPERLARPVIFIALRDVFDEPTWYDWFERVSSPKPFASWSEMFESSVGLAKRHNTKAFLLDLYVAIQETEKPALRRLLTPLRQALQKLD